MPISAWLSLSTAARFVIVDTLWRSWAQIHVPVVTAVLDTVTTI